MIGKEILDKTFSISFRPGSYTSQIKPLDTQGMVTRKHLLEMEMLMLEALDKLDERLKTLENATSEKRDSNKSL